MNLLSGIRPILAALAILLSPGVLGPWLDLAHACPATAAAESTSMAGHKGHHQGMDHKGGRQECHCVGTCHIAALPASRGTPVIAVAATAPAGSGLRAVPASGLTPPSHTLPFAHAPPSLA
jgi:hypothetical protein